MNKFKQNNIRWRLLFFGLLLLFLIWYAKQTKLINIANLNSRLPWSVPTQEQSALKNSLKISESLNLIQSLRSANELTELISNETLNKTARLATLEIEDSQNIEAEIDYQTILASISSDQPPQLESLALFVSNQAQINQILQNEDSEIVKNKQFTQLGIASRSAMLNDQAGVILVILASPDFVNQASQNTAQSSKNTVKNSNFTGQDLWDAVQNYRRAHQLPTFEKSTELCTVASIRLNEQLTLGKLDNHDGFDARADEFFERNQGWTSINENLAQGYNTAVQTVEWGWDQSLGHQALIQSVEYPKACTAAQNGFAVLITGK